MKNSIYKALINWYQSSDKPLPQWLERACAKDAELRKEQAFGEELTRALKKSPNGSEPFEADSMAAKVLNQITEEDYLSDKEAESGSAWGAWVRNAGMAAAAFAVAVAGYQFLDMEKPGGDEAEVVTVVNAEEATDGLLDEIPEDWKNPLDQEIEYIVSDAKGALGFLASTFVPSSYLADEEEA